jgi:coenzyme F420-reducing hydrogenase beta subunit
MNKNNDICCGCGACVVICTKNNINIELNESGFFEKKLLNKNICFKCSLCEKICQYGNKNNILNDPINYYSFTTNDSDVLKIVSSGGAAYEIAKELNKEGYSLCGVKYDKEAKIAKHFVVDSIDEYMPSVGSKYLQSYTVDAIIEVIKKEKIAFFGTPCQISGIKKLIDIKKLKNNIIYIDFFCHGVPSYCLWNHYINNDQKIVEEKMCGVNFRNKNQGWGKFVLSFYDMQNKEISLSKKYDLFYLMYFSNKVLNLSCYNCLYKGIGSNADIRVGDYWGKKKEKNDGVSCLITFSNKAEKILEKIQGKAKICIEKKEDILSGQMLKSPKINKERNIIINKLKIGTPSILIKMAYAKKEIIKKIIPENIKNHIKSISKK